MPTYDYQCPDCGHEFEEFHSISAKPIKKCPKCGKRKVKRLIGSGGGVIFKGTGFYQTDYKGSSKPASKPESTDTKPAPAPEKPAASKPDSKPGNKPANNAD
jgi:putative FmdB family regulatory protein